MHDVIENNGSGEILWDKTINDTFTLLRNQKPYYFELLTKKRVSDEYDYFKRLHECVLGQATAELKQADLIELFNIMPVELSEETFADFGGKDYILYRIENELSIQFNTRKQLLLKTIYAYVKNNGGLYDTSGLSMIGTNKFHRVWERLCADALDSQLNTPLAALQLPVSLKPTYESNKPLISIIEKPLWYGEGYRRFADDTLIPDLISIANIDGVFQFVIFDAKYYTPQLDVEKPLKAQPGIESIAKQYLYQLAFQSFVEEHEISDVRNCFLMPTEQDVIVDKGYASMSMLDDLGLKRIQVRFLPASLMYAHYLSGTKLELRELNL